MSKIRLYLRDEGWSRPEIASHGSHVIRLRCWVQSGMGGGQFTEPHDAVVDTGAPVGLLPRRIWQALNPEVLVPETTIGGISRKKDCQLRVGLERLRGRVVDEEGNASPPLAFPAYLASTNRAPLLLGFAGVLSELRCYFDYGTREAWLEARG